MGGDLYPALGMFLFAAPWMLLSSSTVLLIFLDYHKRGNMHKALLFVAAIVSTGWLFLLLPQGWKLTVALISPLLVFVYAIIAKRRRKS